MTPLCILLGMATFALYGADHVLDLQRKKQHKSFPKLGTALLFLLGSATCIYAFTNPYLLPFIGLCSLAVPPTWAYFKATLFTRSRSVGYSKEWIIALIACYVMCIVPQILMSVTPGPETLLFFLLCLHNTYLCSQIDYSEDKKNQKYTFATIKGLARTKQLLWVLMGLCIALWCMMLMKPHSNVQLALFGSMIAALFACQIATQVRYNTRHTVALKLWADSLFLYPLATFIY